MSDTAEQPILLGQKKKKPEMIKGYSIIKQYVEKNETEF